MSTRSNCAAAVMFALALGAFAADKPASGLLTPVFPASPPGLVWTEGEDAVSTNMATEPTLNYGCSDNRALQLSRSGQLPGGAAFYAEYTMYVDQAGGYELWYGGTPPGAKDEYSLSFASPVSVAIDGGSPRQLFREDVNVVERYAPAYYWVRTPAIQLAQGAHVVRFEVTTQRRLDNRFFFYLDALFLATPDALAAAKADRSGYPELFPKNPDDRSIDHPFRNVEDYLSQIQASPAAIGPYIELSDEYSLMGDYLNALKTLSRAIIVDPKNPDLRLLTAKNRIWRGDVKEGIEAYGIYISLRPDDLAAYEEAGKIAAWSGRYSDSEYFYKTGLAAFPGNASLTVNLGLALLWAGRVTDANRAFADAERASLGDESGAASLAAIYRNNGFPDRAVWAYEKAIAAFPAYLGLYLDESSLLASTGKDQAAKALETRISSVFAPSPELDAALASARARRQLKADRIAELEARIAANPENFGLRDELTRVYAWNGRKAEAARELESILAARFAASIAESDKAIADVYAAQFSAAALRGDADARLATLGTLRAKVLAAQAAVDKAMAALRAAEKAAVPAKPAAKAAPPAATSTEAAPSTAPAAAAPDAAGATDASSATAAAPAGATDASSATAAAPAGTDSGAPAAEPPPAVIAARSAALAALAELASAVTAFEAEDARAALLVQSAGAEKTAMDAASARDAEDEKAFKTLISGLGWRFDASYAAEELSVPASRGEQIASLAKARVLLPLKDGKAAQVALAAVVSENLSANRLQAQLMMDARRDYKSLYKAASAADEAKIALSPALAAAAAELSSVAAATPASDAPAPPAEAPAAQADTAAIAAYADSLREAAKAVLAADSRTAAAATAARGSLAALVQAGAVLEDKRLERARYSFESSVLDLRSELGSYYDGLGEAQAATRQYRRVLALDPSNIRAMHSLALAEDKAGDWAAAAALFRAVNAADPYYLNAAALYNGIARAHAPGYDASTSVLADPNLFDYHYQASVYVPLGSFLALKPFADVRSIRDRFAGDPAYIGATVGIETPIGFAFGSSGDSLVIRPSASLIATSADFSAYGATMVTPNEFLSALSMYSAAGMAVDLGTGAWRSSVSYSYAPLPDSLNPANIALFAHRLELSEGAYLPLDGIFRYLAPRVYASGGYVPGDLGNMYGTALAELIPAFRLSDLPWANLGLPLDIVYEDSKISRTTPYYAADQALTLKGGLLFQSTYSFSGGDSLSVSLEGMGGVYSSQTFSASPSRYPYLFAFARLDWLRPEVSYSLTLEASATDPFNPVTPQYWSFSILGGVSAKQPSLIAP